ncbi:MAG: hypothetical protein ACI9LM_002774 [Alteromonadaceae bacterium]|jgi:hypothetical protein
MAEQQEMNEQEQQEWVRNSYKTATKYLADKGMVTESVVESQSRYLVPALAVWKLNLLDKTSAWVICGDLPTDHANTDVAVNARDVIRHFSFKWQMQAENVGKSGQKEQEEFANLLISRAEGLYGLYEKEELWANS